MPLSYIFGLVSLALVCFVPIGCSPDVTGPAGPEPLAAPSFRSAIEIDGEVQLELLLADEDTDRDLRITVLDPRLADGRGDRRFELATVDGDRFEVAGTYELSNLLQQISLALETADRPISIDPDRIWELPTRRIGRSIRDLYWDGLTRRIDGQHLEGILSDEKLDGERPADRYLFVPHDDRRSLEHFCAAARARPELRLQVERLPATIDPAWVRSLDSRWQGARVVTADPCSPKIGSTRSAARHGLLSLALSTNQAGETVGVPFVVPGGRFNEMYGWDSYFEALGLLADGRIDLARSMVDNFVYQIEHYGKILNANRTYYLTRSQPPFLTSMISAVYRRLPPGESRTAWLRRSLLAAISEYESVWSGPGRLTANGLSRYHGLGIGAPPEVEPGHFDHVYLSRAGARGVDPAEYEEGYRSGALRDPALDRYFEHDRCMRESGHDTTYRWDVGGNRCGDFVTVDLNSLLHKTEVDIARMIRDELGDRLLRADGTAETSAAWYGRAAERRARIQEYLWDEERSMYFDYDIVRRSRHPYVSATALYPLWAWNPDDPTGRWLTDEQARRLVAAVLPLLEARGGVAASSLESRGPLSATRPLRQWDYPHGWAPHQMLVWRGLRNHGLDEIADRLTYKWLYTITINAVEYNGTVPEKFDVVRRSHRVFAEYGNVGTDFDYITREGFGWMNASYQVGLASLPPSLRSMLDRLVAPESIDFGGG